MPLWLHAFVGAIGAAMAVQIYRALTVGKIMAGLSEIEKAASPRYFSVLKYGHIAGLVALLIWWAAVSFAFGVK